MTPQAVELVFLPELNRERIPERYHIFLTNHTERDLAFEVSLSLQGVRVCHRSGRLPGTSSEGFFTLLHDQLNESPAFDIRCLVLPNGAELEKSFRLKPQQFFRQVRQDGPDQVHWLTVFDKLEPPRPASKEDLRTYTKKELRDRQEEDPDLVWWQGIHPVELAHFEPEIDLHIEKLVENSGKLGAGDILRIQLQHFEAFLERALEVGAPQIYVIHGLGTGKLRGAIHDRLARHPEVVSFKNEYHFKYGYGATEIIL